MKPGLSGAVIGSFVVRRRQAAHDLHQLHQGNRIEEVQAAEPIRPLGARGEFGNAQRRRIGRKDALRSDDRIEGRVRGGLVVDVLDDGLDDQVARRHRHELGDAREVAERFVARLGRHLPLLDAAVQKLPNPAEPLVEGALIHLADDRLEARRGRHLRDPGAHQAASQHADCSDFHPALLFYSRSMIAAMPCPPPMHAVARP
jgi:hypothetical protein